MIVARHDGSVAKSRYFVSLSDQANPTTYRQSQLWTEFDLDRGGQRVRCGAVAVVVAADFRQGTVEPLTLVQIGPSLMKPRAKPCLSRGQCSPKPI